MKMISAAEFQQHLAAQPNLLLIDVRTPVEYAEMHVPQARNEPLDQLQPKTVLDNCQLAKDQPVYLICRSGARAARAAGKFAAAGHDQTVVIEGGTLACDACGFPVVRGTVKVISLERQVRIAAGALVLTGVLLGFLVHRGFFILSGFVGAGLVFAGITDFCGMGLLLAKMPWNNRKTV